MTSRERFEKHWYDFYHAGSIQARPNGRYMQLPVQAAWDAWQASERQALERVIAMLEADNGEATEWGYERYARYTKEVVSKIRALNESNK